MDVLGCTKDLVNKEWLRNLLLLTNLPLSHTIFMSIYFYLWNTINTLHLLFIYPLTYPCNSMRVIIIISIHICQYLYANTTPQAPPCGKNINDDTWYTPRWNATMVYYLCACRHFNIYFSLKFTSVINNYQPHISGIMLGMTT